MPFTTRPLPSGAGRMFGTGQTLIPAGLAQQDTVRLGKYQPSASTYAVGNPVCPKGRIVSPCGPRHATPVILSDGVHTSVYRFAPCNRSVKLPCVKTAADALLILTEHHRTALCQRHIPLKGACIRIDTVDIASRRVCGTAPCDRKGLWLRVRQRVGVEVWGVIRPLSQNM